MTVPAIRTQVRTLTPTPWHDTVIARWHRRLAVDVTGDKSHWRTKTAYYKAASELVAAGHAARLTWRAIVATVRPRGSRSTFYEVAGANARHPLIGDLIRDGRVDSIHLALCYQRAGAVDYLVDETKVWSFWPYREALVSSFEPDPAPGELADAVERAVGDWAERNPRLAAALDFAPPACAVEDLLVAMSGRLSPLCAADLLGRRTRAASGMPATVRGPGTGPALAWQAAGSPVPLGSREG